MMNATHPHLRTLAVAALSAWLASCATAPPVEIEVPRKPEEQALAAEREGAYARAAEYWLLAASATVGGRGEAYRLKAAEAWLQSGDTRNANTTLDGLQQSAQAREEQQRYRILRAELALAEGNVTAALDFLGQGDEWLDPTLGRRAAALNEQIRLLQSGAGSALLQRIAGDLSSMAAFNLTEALALLASYEYVPTGRLWATSTLSVLNPRAASWAEFMARFRAAIMQDAQLGDAARDWMRDFPQHEIGREEFLELAFLYSQRFSAPARVAVLLPTQGGLAAAGRAIRDGLLSAYLENPGASTLSFLETGESPAQAVAAYRQAIESGADWVVGPVRQSSVQAIVELEGMKAPTLALNDIARPVAVAYGERFFTLSLSQEAEAAAIAGKMQQAGIQNVITLTTDSDWGNRMEAAFVEAFSAGGGEVVDLARFSASASDHSAELTRVLQIDQSRERKDRLQTLLGSTLSFEPRLRDDFDAFFLSSVPEQARQIRPQLRFFEAGETPLFAVSRVYSGIPDPTADRDLNGTILPLSTLQLEAAGADLPALTSVRGGAMLNLYALGADAWNLLRWLPLLQRDPDLAYTGKTGALHLAADGRLDRQPSWAMFIGGQPVAYEPVKPSEE
jgi:outer membrane PBP1 activator LpoA protein